MRICLVSSSFYPAIFYGGPISSTWDLSKKIGNNGVKVFVSTTNANGKERLRNVETNKHKKITENVYVKYYHEQIINVVSLSFLFNIYSDIKKSDVVYIQYLFHYTVFISLLFSFLQKKKIIICPRGRLSSWGLKYKKKWIKKTWINFLIRPFIKNVRWHACSYLEVKDIKNVFKNSDVVEINDGIDFQSFQNSKKIDKIKLVNNFTSSSFDKVEDVFFSMGRLHEIKGFDIIIDAFNIHLKLHKNDKLIIAGGDDGERKNLEEQIRRLNLQDSVFLIGAVNHFQKCELLTNSTAFILASHFESFGIVIAESLACGTPVIVSNKTSWNEIETNKCGIFTENDIIGFVKSLSDIKEINFNKEQIKNYVNSTFDWKIITNKFLETIRN